jgi:inosine/xanthosine triphosphatase
MKIAVGTTNPAKLEAVKKVFDVNTEIISGKVPSGVSEQPFSDEETIRGAINRAKAAQIEFSSDIAIGLEGGVTETPFGLMLCNWGALVSENEKVTPMIAGGARILLPEYISARLRNGEELGPVMDDFCNKNDIRSHEGAVGIFTNGRVKRDAMFKHVVELLKGQYEYHSQKRNV